MKPVTVRIAAMVFVVATSMATGTSLHSGAAARSPVAGQQERATRTLSPGDIGDLKAGRGWGLARPAELNRSPGPRHVVYPAEAAHRELRPVRLLTTS